MYFLRDYLTALQRQLATGQAGEHAYRPALQALLQAATDLQAVNEPRHIEVGAPDFIVLHGQVPVGFVEAKDLDADLSRIERSEQLGRYRQAFHNLILTNHLEFRWYVGGELRLTAVLGTFEWGKLHPARGGEAQLVALLKQFAAQVAPTISLPRDLAERMAAITREIRHLLVATLASADRGDELHAQLVH